MLHIQYYIRLCYICVLALFYHQAIPSELKDFIVCSTSEEFRDETSNTLHKGINIIGKCGKAAWKAAVGRHVIGHSNGQPPLNR